MNAVPFFDMQPGAAHYAQVQGLSAPVSNEEHLALFSAVHMTDSVHAAVVAIKNITPTPLAIRQLLVEIASMTRDLEFQSGREMGAVDHLDAAVVALEELS